MNSNHYAYAENPDNSAEVAFEFSGSREQVLDWARNLANEGYQVYAFDQDEKRIEL